MWSSKWKRSKVTSFRKCWEIKRRNILDETCLENILDRLDVLGHQNSESVLTAPLDPQPQWQHGLTGLTGSSLKFGHRNSIFDAKAEVSQRAWKIPGIRIESPIQILHNTQYSFSVTPSSLSNNPYNSQSVAIW